MFDAPDEFVATLITRLYYHHRLVYAISFDNKNRTPYALSLVTSYDVHLRPVRRPKRYILRFRSSVRVYVINYATRPSDGQQYKRRLV